jgi:nucleotide-binding universal stress UspA family protein
VTSVAAAGTPYDVLIRRSEETKADLVVVGSHGRSTLGRAVLGSVSMGVLHHARCSVRVGRRGIAAAVNPDGPVKLLLGVDGSEGSARAVAAVSRRSWPAGSRLHLVSVLDLRVVYPVLAGSEALAWMPAQPVISLDDERQQVQQILEQAAEEPRRAGLSVETTVLDGDPKQALIAAAEDWGADCLFVGAQGLSRLERFLIGSVSSTVAARARCSVEVIRG